LLISPTRALRDQINNEIRVGLERENSLAGKKINFTALTTKNLNPSDYNFAYSYKEGDVIKFNKNYKNGITKGDYLKIKSVNKISNLLLLEKNGKNIVFNFRQRTDYANKLEVFQEKNLQLQEGLKIIFTKNNKAYGLINSETAVIEKIEMMDAKISTNKYDLENENYKNRTSGFNEAKSADAKSIDYQNPETCTTLIKLKFDDNSCKSIRLDQLKHIDYGYCVTVHSSQGKTFDHTITTISNNKLLTTQKMWLVALSRHKSTFTAIVEDKDKLKSYLIHNSGSVISATELQSKIDSGNITKTNEVQPIAKIEKGRGIREMQIG
jgi:ATP-dependent exoDNAse (exonuclease V) alpha subunit